MRLIRISNAIVRARPKPHYVVFPELAIPRRWARTLAHHFLKEGISLITGLEYFRSNKEVTNEVRLYLTDNRLGYSSWCTYTQQKHLPAHHEREELRSKFGVSFPRPKNKGSKIIYDHFGFRFGVLVCSELTNIKHREHFRGKIDNLFILSWNQDLEVFSSLVESSALDIHCFVTLINNRRYGDSRVRAPYKDAWRRDLVRVKGGLDDYFIVTELEVGSLREFQSHEEPPSRPFKPTPEGYYIDPARYITPGTLKE